MPKVGCMKYTQEALNDAVYAVRKGMGLNEAARIYGVPKSTLKFRKDKPLNIKITMGPCPILGKEENTLITWIEECYRKGFPRRKDDLLDSVKEIVEDLKIKTPFTNNRPGNGWYRAFLKRHPDMAKRKPEAVTTASACISESDIRGWFKNIEQTLTEDGLLDILKDSNRIINGDETSILLCPKLRNVIAPKGARNVYEVDIGQSKAAITCMFSFTASGDIIPPMLIYPFKRIPRDVVDKIPKNWGVGRSENGWMTAEVFYEYIGNVLSPYLIMNKIKLPVILFVDGHRTHLTLHVSQLCTDLQIILIALYPNATRILRPADVSAFRPLKAAWNEEVRAWRNDHLHETITKDLIAPLLSQAISKSCSKETLQNGFKTTGLFPWNPDAIDYTKCIATRKSIANTSTMNNNVLTYDRFSEIVSQEKISIYTEMERNMHEIDNTEPNSNELLYKIFKEFRSNHNSENLAVDNADENNSEPGPSHTDNISENSSNSKFAKILRWPDSPKRKGKRNVDRLPYVITSEQWQKIVFEKSEKRKAEEKTKEQRRKWREERKKQKEEEAKEIKAVPRKRGRPKTRADENL